MQALKRFSSFSRQLNRSTVLLKPSASVSRSFSTTFVEREHFEESKYIRSEEAKRAADLKAKLETILAKDDSDQEKSELIGLLEKPEKKSFIERFRLNDPFVAGPVGFALLIPGLEKGFVVFNEETYVAVAFVLFCSSIYNYLGPGFAKDFDEGITTIRSGLTTVDNVTKNRIIAEIKETEDILNLESHTKEVHQLVDDLSVLQAESLTHQAEHKYRDSIAKKLDSLVALENAAVSNLRTRALNEVTADAMNLFKNDKKIKEAALNQALAVLTAGPNAKIGKDVVGETFISSLKTYRENYAKQPAGSDKIIADLEKDILAIISEPKLDEKGGNVYETHPVSKHLVA